MTTHRLFREQLIPRPIEDVFAFFADARNLEAITPSWLRFEMLTPQPVTMQAGAILQYSLRLHGWPIHWTTAITVWRPPFEFVDVQLRGPYRLWHHRHTFETVGDATRMIDEVDYRLPFGWAGSLAHGLFVRRDLQAIFDYRQETVARLTKLDS